MPVYKITFIALVVGGLLLSFFMLPSERELGLMYLQERELTQAETVYRQLALNGELQREDLSPLTRIYIEQGFVQRAIAVYEQYLAHNRGDTEVQKQLAKLYFDTRRFHDYMGLMEDIVAREPKLEYLDELARLYRKFGKNSREIAVLQRLLAEDATRVKDYQRLIQLLAEAGDFETAEQRLTAYHKAGNPFTPTLAELRLRLLISAGRYTAALDWAAQWLLEHRHSASRFIAVLYSAGASNRLAVAFDLPPALAPNAMSDWLLRAVIRVAWREKKSHFLAQFTAQLSAARQAEVPVAMTKAALASADSALVNAWLARAESLSDYLPQQSEDLLDIYLETQQVEKALAVLSRLAQQPTSAASIYREAAGRLLELGASEAGFGLFQHLKHQTQNIGIHYAWALFAAAEGRDDVLAWFAGEAVTALAQQQWLDVFYAALDREHSELAVALARQLNRRFAGVQSLQLLVYALLQAGAKQEALVLVKRQLQAAQLTPAQRREMAFLLLRAGEKQAAVAVFQGLAQSQGPSGKDVQQLLYLWGPLPGDAVLDWLENRAKQAAPSQVVGWWQNMLQVGAAERVLAMGEEMSKAKGSLSAQAGDVLVGALLAKGELGVAAKKLKQQAKNTRDTQRLEHLAQVAQGRGLNAVETFIWRRLFKLQPDNAKANRNLGLAAFYRDDRQATKNHLAQYLKQGGNDWESEFYLAEVMYADGRPDSAKTYFQRSLDQINKSPKPAKRQRVARALMHYRLGKMATALKEYDLLIAEFPQDKALRADYSTLLIDQGRFNKARRILGEK